MEAYFYLLGLLFILTGLGVTGKHNYFYELLISCLFIGFSGLRYKVGIDYESYERIFHLVENSDFDILFLKELGFVFLIKGIVFIGGTSQLMFLFCSVFYQIYIYKFVKYFKANFYLAMLIFLCISPYYFASFNGLRQSIAIAVFAYSLKYVIERNFRKYLLLLVATGFMAHASAFFLIPFYFILGKNIGFKKKILLITTSVAFGLLIPKLLSFTPYAHYLNRSREYDVQASLAIFLFFVLSLCIILFERKINLPEKYRSLLLNMNLFSFIFIALALLHGEGTFYMLFTRINNYFFVIHLILIPLILASFKSVELKRFVFLLLTILIVGYYWRTIYLNGERYFLVPYQYNLELFN